MPKRQRSTESPNDIRQNIPMFQTNNRQDSQPINSTESWQQVMYALQQQNQRLQQENDALRNRLASTTNALETLKNNEKICRKSHEKLQTNMVAIRENFEKRLEKRLEKTKYLLQQASGYAQSVLDSLNPNSGTTRHMLEIQTGNFLAFLEHIYRSSQ